MRAFLEWTGRQGAWLLFTGVLAGLVVPPLAAWLRPAVLPVTFMLFVASLVRLDWSLVLHHIRRPRRALLIVVAIMVGAPLVAALAFKALPAPDTLATSIILTTTTTPLLSSPAFALLLGLEAELALIVVLLAMILVPVTMPVLALALLGLEINLSFAELMGRLALFVGAGFACAMALRAWIGPGGIKAEARLLDGVNVVLLVVFAVGVMDGVTGRLIAEPGHVLLFTAAAFVLNATQQALGTAIFWIAGRRTALTVGLVFGYRNMALALAVLADVAPPDFLLYVAVAQLPMYMFPMITRPIYRRLLKV
jgi:BASS family bile acid:Na+ symporter